MKHNKSNWSKIETKLYLLLFCVNTDYTVAKHHIDYNRFNIEKFEFDKIRSEFNKDNDYQSIQKIRLALENNDYSKDQLNILFQEIKAMFSLTTRRNNLIINNIFTNLERIIIKAA